MGWILYFLWQLGVDFVFLVAAWVDFVLVFLANLSPPFSQLVDKLSPRARQEETKTNVAILSLSFFFIFR